MCYKLRIIGVPIDGPPQMMGDNESMATSLSITSSNLKKKHNAMAYHQVREYVYAGGISMAHIP